jgi:hypothetical protein
MKPLYRLLITSLILAFLSACGSSSSSDPAAASSGTTAASSGTAAATNKFPQVTVSD